MPPTFRSSRSGRQFIDNSANRSRTGQVDHDVFEGLPVRRWTRQQHTFSQASKMEEVEAVTQGPDGKQTLPELPMPRDSHLLTPMSRALLRAARAGCIYIRHVSKETEDEEKEVTDADESAAVHRAERSFSARKWGVVPRHMEPPEVEFLAKRRPGLPSLYGASGTAPDGASNVAPTPMRKTKFKKVDPATGNISVYEAWVPEGHRIEGEITEDTPITSEISDAAIIPEAPAPGTVVEGVGVVNAVGVVVAEAGSAAVMTPPKRRPPPPKRKAKGIGKGRKKKVMFAPGEGVDATLVHGATPGTDGAAVSGVKDENADASRMSVEQSGQEEEEEDGDEGDESDEGDEPMPDAKTPDTSSTAAVADTLPQAVTETALQPGAVTESISQSTPAEPASGPTTDISGTQVAADAQPSGPELPSAMEVEQPSQQAPPPEPIPQALQASHEIKQSTADLAVPASAAPTEQAPQPSAGEAPAAEDTDMMNDAPPQSIPGVQNYTNEKVPFEAQAAPEPPSEPAEPVSEVVEQIQPQENLQDTAPNPPSGNIESIQPMVASEQTERPLPETTPAPAKEAVAPQAPLSRENTTGTTEVDLLGSLEASLGNTAGEQVTQPEDHAPAPQIENGAQKASADVPPAVPISVEETKPEPDVTPSEAYKQEEPKPEESNPTEQSPEAPQPEQSTPEPDTRNASASIPPPDEHPSENTEPQYAPGLSASAPTPVPASELAATAVSAEEEKTADEKIAEPAASTG